MNNGHLRLGVGSGAVLDDSRWLFSQLEPVIARRIIPTSSREERGDADVILHPRSADLESATQRGLPVFASYGPQEHSVRGGIIAFTFSDILDRRLRGLSLWLPELAVCHLSAAPGDEILALHDGKPIWLQRRINGQVVQLAGVGLSNQNGQRPLDWARDDGQVVAMVPLIHFLRRLDGHKSSAGIRACFVVDDPNLRWPAFGYLGYRDVLQDALAYGYHVSAALIPIDTLLYNPRVVQIFKEHPEQLSVSIHGNNHTREEWNLPDLEPALRSFAQAVRRVERFERRTGLSIDRVATPPHGVMSLHSLRAARMCGIEAMTITPEEIPDPHYFSEYASGIGPALVGRGTTPLLLRRPLQAELGWFGVHAFLDQPIILYLHHQDLADGTEILRRIAQRINGLGNVRWCSLAEMVAGCHTIRTDGDAATFRLFASRVRAQVPDGVASAVFEYPTSPPGATVWIRRSGAEFACKLGVPVAVAPGETLSISAMQEEVDPYSIPPPRRHPWPAMRRFMTETRDRFRPLLRM